MSAAWEDWKDERRAQPLSASQLDREPETDAKDETPRAEHGAVIWDEAALEALARLDRRT